MKNIIFYLGMIVFGSFALAGTEGPGGGGMITYSEDGSRIQVITELQSSIIVPAILLYCIDGDWARTQFLLHVSNFGKDWVGAKVALSELDKKCADAKKTEAQR